MPRMAGGGMAFFIPGTAVVGAKQVGAIAASNFTIHHVEVYSNTAPTGASLIVDVNLNLVTIYTTQANRPTITTGTKVGSRVVPDIVAVSAGDVLTVDVDAVGSTVAGGGPLLLTIVML
mgnify:FL=1